MSSILSLFSKGEEKVLDEILGYYGELYGAYKAMVKFMDALSASSKAERDLYNEVSRLEKDADKIHESLSQKIASGSFFSYIRDDFLDLLETMDNIADFSKDACKVFLEYNLDSNSIDFLFNKTQFKRFIDGIGATLESMREVLQSLKRKPPNDVLKLISNVESNEELTDSVKDQVLIDLHNKAKCAEKSDCMSVLDVITIRDVVNMMDNIADSAEDASDIILRLMAKGYK